MSNDLDPDFAALATEALRLESRITGISTRTSSDFKTVLMLESAGLSAPEVTALSDALKSFRRRHDLAAEFLLVNSTSARFVPRVPTGWPPTQDPTGA